jgi:hypothetical protein
MTTIGCLIWIMVLLWVLCSEAATPLSAALCPHLIQRLFEVSETFRFRQFVSKRNY